jgi:hypothetical protein
METMINQAVEQYPSQKTAGGYLVAVPENQKLYFIESLPLSPFGVNVTDIGAKAALAQRHLEQL